MVRWGRDATLRPYAPVTQPEAAGEAGSCWQLAVNVACRIRTATDVYHVNGLWCPQDADGAPYGSFTHQYVTFYRAEYAR